MNTQRMSFPAPFPKDAPPSSSIFIDGQPSCCSHAPSTSLPFYSVRQTCQKENKERGVFIPLECILWWSESPIFPCEKKRTRENRTEKEYDDKVCKKTLALFSFSCFVFSISSSSLIRHSLFSHFFFCRTSLFCTTTFARLFLRHNRRQEQEDQTKQ